MKQCLSTHGGAGYMSGSYWDGDAIVCICCGMRIENPAPTSYQCIQYRFRENPIKWLRGTVKEEIPLWPDWILGKRGKPWPAKKAQSD